MSLNFDLAKIKNYQDFCFVGEGDQKRYSPVTEGLIWASMTVGLGEISEKNVNEWMARLSFSDRLLGTLLKQDGQNRPFTREEVETHVGLRTNVSNETRNKWVKRITERFFRDFEYDSKLRKAG